jgi:hypothetical protein
MTLDSRRLLITTDVGLAINRAAVMRDAQRQWRQMSRHGWDWRQCVRFSHHKAMGQRDLLAFTAVEAAMRRLLNGPQ